MEEESLDIDASIINNKGNDRNLLLTNQRFKKKYILKLFLLLLSIIMSLNIIFYNNNKIKLFLNNYFELPYYENNYNFSKYLEEEQLDIKAIALYESTINLNEIRNLLNENFTKILNSTNEKEENIFENYDNKYNNLTYTGNIISQIELARSHGIYGFGIYYYFYSDLKFSNEPLESIFNNKNIDFHYFLIWKNEDIKINNHNLLIKSQYNKNSMEKFIIDIKNYLLDERYIKVNNSPIIGIYSPNNIDNISSLISIWRLKAKEVGIENIFILGYLNSKNLKNETIYKNKILDGIIFLPNFEELFRDYNNQKYFFYKSLLYEFEFNKIIDLKFFGSIPLMEEKEIKKGIKSNEIIKIFDDYNAYKFYLLNKYMINYTYNNFNKENRFIFIDSFNNFIEKNFLDKDGYASLNSLSKALFNLTLETTSYNNYNLINLKKNCLIAVQAHIYFIDLLEEIINKTNNIPVKFDLYITTTSSEKKKYIEKNIKNYSKHNNYEILVLENKGRDVLPLIIQFKRVYKKYKYFCHIHSKKTEASPKRGYLWRRYLFDNLLGSKEIISEILTNFENNNKLGFIFPETYIELIKYFFHIDMNNIKYLNYLLNYIFPGYRIGGFEEFPAGNMFWARVDAVYQIFEGNILEQGTPKERGQLDSTILHAVERIWTYIVQLNGYSYSKTFRKC